MKKIPTLFVRDEDDRKYVTRQINPGCEWVLAGEGRATRKFDGTCVLIRRDGLAVEVFMRREVKADKQPPENFIQADFDPVTGKTVGWEPAGQTGWAAIVAEVLDSKGGCPVPGTYELVGPKVNRNPEGYERHVLIAHGEDDLDVPLDFDGLRGWLLAHPYEGIVWHHPDGRMVKLKRRDMPSSTDEEGRTGLSS